MKLWPYSLSGPGFLTVFTCAIVLGLLAWVWSRERQRGAIRERIREVPLDTYQLAYLRGGAVAAVETALLALRTAGKVTRAGTRFLAVAGATAAGGAHELERAVLDTLATVPRTCRELVSRLERPLARLDHALVERGWIVPSRQRVAQSLIAKVPLALVALAGAVRVLQGVQGGYPVGFLVAELTVLGALIAVLPRLPRRTSRGDAALAHHRTHHDALVRTASTAPQQLAPMEVALSYALAGASIGAVAAVGLGRPRARDAACGTGSATDCGCTSGDVSGCGGTSGCSSGGGSSGCSSGGGSSGCSSGGGGCGGCGGGGGD